MENDRVLRMSYSDQKFESTNRSEVNIKSNIIWHDVLTNLVTFNFRGIYFWRNPNGNRNSKILNNDAKQQKTYCCAHIWSQKYIPDI